MVFRMFCITQLTEFTHDVITTEAPDHWLSVECGFLDVRKAFDAALYALVIDKLITLTGGLSLG